jgi:hypothetical protein
MVSEQVLQEDSRSCQGLAREVESKLKDSGLKYESKAVEAWEATPGLSSSWMRP